MKVAKAATVGLGVIAVLLGLLFKGQNVAFMVGLAFAVASSANFPALLMSITWKRFTTAGAVASIYTGLTLAVVLICLSPTVFEDVFQATQTKALAGASAKVVKLDKYAKDSAKALGELKQKTTALGVALADPALDAKAREAKSKELAGTNADVALLEGGGLSAALATAKADKVKADGELKKAPLARC
jgi:hypothetical protein